MSAKKKAEPAKVGNSIPAPKADVKTTPDLFNQSGNKVLFVLLGMVLLAAFIIFKDYLLFEKAYLFKDIGSDSLNAQYPSIYYLTSIIHGGHFPTWSFSCGMGQNVFPTIFRDPFDIMFYFLGKGSIDYGIIYKEVLKFITIAIVFYYYLKTMGLTSFTSVTGSLLFSCSGYIIVGSGWQVISLEALQMAFLLLAFEQLFCKDRWYLFPISIFCICISMPFNLYIYGVFLTLYALMRLFQTNNFTIKGICILFGKMIGFGLLGMLICAPFLMENIAYILQSPRGSGTVSYSHTLSATSIFTHATTKEIGTCIMRFFSSDILGSGSEFKGIQNMLEAPLFYCGLPCLLLMPQVFPFLEKKVRIGFIVFLAIWVLPVIFPYFRYAFWLFTGDYYRAYSLFVAFVFLYYAVVALDFIVRKQKINLVILGITFVALLILLNLPYFEDKEVLNSGLSFFVVIMLMVYAVILFFMGRLQNITYLKYFFIAAVFFEVVYSSCVSVNNRDTITAEELTQKVGYNDYTRDAVAYIGQREKSPFYRIDKSYGSSPAIHYSQNDAMVQGYRSTNNYSSFNQEYYIKYLAFMGVIDGSNELASRWANAQFNRPILEGENQVKYILAKTKTNPIWTILCDSLTTIGNVRVYKHKFTMPFGYTYDHYISESSVKPLENTQKDFISLRSSIVSDKDISKVAGLKEFRLQDTIPLQAFSTELYQQYVTELRKDTLVVTKFDETQINGNISLNDDKMMYLSIPYDGGWTLKVDGKVTDKIILSAGMTGVMLKKGQHTIEMAYHLRYFGNGIILSFMGVLVYLAIWLYQTRVVRKRGIANKEQQ